MKGMEMPISTIVIIVIVLIVLLAVIAMFFGVWNPGVSGISLEAAKDSACQRLVSIGCVDTTQIVVNDFDADRDGTLDEGPSWDWANPGNSECGDTAVGATEQDNLAALCKCYYFVSDEDSCKNQICNCRD